MQDIKERIAALRKYPQHLIDLLEMDYEIASPAALVIEQRDSALARLALAREWINTRVPHLEGCPWRGLTRDAQGLLPDCRCGRDALLKALEVPK